MGGRPTDATLGYRVTFLGVSNVTTSNVTMKLYYEIMHRRSISPSCASPPPPPPPPRMLQKAAVLAKGI